VTPASKFLKFWYNDSMPPKSTPARHAKGLHELEGWAARTMRLPDFRRKILGSAVLSRSAAYAVFFWLAGMLFLAISCSPTPSQNPGILLITLDTTRWDHLSCYGYPRESTPTIDRLAEEGMRYERAVSPSSWTLPAHASLFTGMLPTHHSAHFGSDENAKVDEIVGFSFYTLHPMVPTLAEELGKAGYATCGIIAGPTISSRFGMGRGFDHYDDRLPKTDIPERRADEISSLAIHWLKEHHISQSAKPFFLFLNYFDPHNPYQAPEPWGDQDVTDDVYNIRNSRYDEVFRGNRDLTDDEREILLKQYEDEIRFMDSEIGSLFDEMRRLGMYDSTLIVVVSDHGESFGEHRLLEHGRALYEELIRVPLIVKYPSHDKRQGVVRRRVSTAGIMPTILNYIGHPVPGTVTVGALDETNHMLAAEVFRDIVWTGRYGKRFDMDQKAVYEGDYKWIWRSNGEPELYKVSDDPGEKNNLYGTLPELENRFQLRLRSLIEESTQLSSLTIPELDQELQRRLKALGYVQ